MTGKRASLEDKRARGPYKGGADVVWSVVCGLCVCRSLFYKMEDKFWHGKALPQEYKGMGEGGSLSAIWKRWREGRRASKGGLMEQHKSDSLDENLARREAIKTVKYH